MVYGSDNGTYCGPFDSRNPRHKWKEFLTPRVLSLSWSVQQWHYTSDETELWIWSVFCGYSQVLLCNLSTDSDLRNISCHKESRVLITLYFESYLEKKKRAKHGSGKFTGNTGKYTAASWREKVVLDQVVLDFCLVFTLKFCFGFWCRIAL